MLYKKRLEKAQGYSIMCEAMCSEMSLGFQLYEIAKLLHRSIFVNGSLVNMETWPNCTNERIVSFERIKQAFFRKILRAHSKTAIEAIYLELGVVPLRYQLKKKRIMYFRDIMDRDDEEITKRIVTLQKKDCDAGDFYEQVKRDINEIGVTEEEMLESKAKLKIVVSDKTKRAAYRYLIDKASKHSKVREDIYTDCEGAGHYNNPRFTPELSNLIFRFRTRTFMVKNNFRNNYANTNILCPLCGSDDDGQEHIFKCEAILKQYKETITSNINDVYSNDPNTLHTVATTLKELVKIRELLLNPDTDGSPS